MSYRFHMGYIHSHKLRTEPLLFQSMSTFALQKSDLNLTLKVTFVWTSGPIYTSVYEQVSPGETHPTLARRRPFQKELMS